MDMRYIYDLQNKGDLEKDELYRSSSDDSLYEHDDFENYDEF
jgi:hypothetical protein